MTIFKTREKSEKTVIENISLDRIYPNPNQPRIVFDEYELICLAQSIKENGVLQPITVREICEGRYELVAGERRVRACRIAGFDNIPAIVTEYSDEESAVLSVIENIQRCNLSFFEEAEAMRRLIAEKGITQEQLAQRLGRSQSTVANKIRLLKLSESIRNLIIGYGLNERQARAVLKLPEDSREKAVEEIHRLSLNVNQTDRYIEALINPERKKKKQQWTFTEKRLYINSINKTLDTMKKSGVPFESERSVEDGVLTYIIRIPQDK